MNELLVLDVSCLLLFPSLNSLHDVCDSDKYFNSQIANMFGDTTATRPSGPSMPFWRLRSRVISDACARGMGNKGVELLSTTMLLASVFAAPF